MPGKITIPQTRAIVLVLLAATLMATGVAWLRSQRQARVQPALPARIPADIAQSAGFSLSHTAQGRTEFTIRAAHVRQQTESGKSVLEEMEIITYGAKGDRHDRIASQRCDYDSKAGRAHCAGAVEIELASLPGQAPAAAAAAPPSGSAAEHRIMARTSSLTFEEKGGIASTEKPVEFQFSGGSGRAVGAVYDAKQRRLQLKAEVQIELVEEVQGSKGPRVQGSRQPLAASPQPLPAQTIVKAAELVYTQRDNKIQLQHPAMNQNLPNGRRDIFGDSADLMLDEHNEVRGAEVQGHVRLDETTREKTGPAGQEKGGGPAPPPRTRETHAAADRAQLVFGEKQAISQAYLMGAVRIQNTAAGDRYEAQAERLELFFSNPNNALGQMEWKGGVRLVLTPGDQDADIRVITSEAIEMFMKPDGQGLSIARTLAPGRLELAPNPAAARAASNTGRRTLTADRLVLEFGDDNQLRLLNAEKAVRLETEVRPRRTAGEAGVKAGDRRLEAGGPPGNTAQARVSPALRVTTSDHLVARFDSDEELESVEQTGNFRFVEGERQGTAERALYTADDEKTVLTGGPGKNPEVWDSHTRTSARRIILDQKNDTGIAEQEVRSTHVPEEKAGKTASTGPLTGKGPVHAIAARMVSGARGAVTRYESAPGGPRVRLWQDQDVMEARSILIEREQQRMTAQGEVATVFSERAGAPPQAAPQNPRPPAPAAGAAAGAAAGQPNQSGPAQPIFITADSLIYTDNEQRAHYQGRVVLRRQESVMRSAALDVFLVPAEEVKPGQSRLERAMARGAVRIDESSARGVRRAAADIAEYVAAEDKMVLSGGEPYIFDEQRGYTRGRQLTYYTRDDRIFVHGDGAARTITEQRVTQRASRSQAGR
jgi:lipopolysaccharide export system protein LptA